MHYIHYILIHYILYTIYYYIIIQQRFDRAVQAQPSSDKPDSSDVTPHWRSRAGGHRRLVSPLGAPAGRFSMSHMYVY
jgi:hypothetical protein